MSQDKDLVQFDELQVSVTRFVAPTLQIKVTDFQSARDATDCGNQIQEFQKQIDAKYKELTAPLNARLKFIRNIVNGIEGPLDSAEKHIKRELAKFADEQKILQEEARRKAEYERREIERKAAEEAQRLAQETEARRQEQLAQLASQPVAAPTDCLFGSALNQSEEIEAQRQAIEAQAEQERLELQAKLEREQKIRDSEAKQREWDIKNSNLKNIRKNWDCEVVDINLVPKEFLIVTLNKAAVIAAAKAGVTIPGVKTWAETTVALGRNSYVPSLALDAERKAKA